MFFKSCHKSQSVKVRQGKRAKKLADNTVPTTRSHTFFRYKRRILGNFQKSFYRLVCTPSFCLTKEHFNIVASQVMLRQSGHIAINDFTIFISLYTDVVKLMFNQTAEFTI